MKTSFTLNCMIKNYKNFLNIPQKPWTKTLQILSKPTTKNFAKNFPPLAVIYLYRFPEKQTNLMGGGPTAE